LPLPTPTIPPPKKKKKKDKEANPVVAPQIICPLTGLDVQRSSSKQWVQLHMELARAATICASGNNIAELFEAEAVAPKRRVASKRRAKKQKAKMSPMTPRNDAPPPPPAA